jgi:hypothetical protein
VAATRYCGLSGSTFGLEVAMKPVIGLGFVLACLLALPAASDAAAKKSVQALPVPKLNFVGTETYEANGFDFIRYKYEVANRGKFKKELFSASPDLPACGEIPNASRTWVDLYGADGKKLLWFCAFTTPDDLAHLWFAQTQGTEPPASVYIEMTDRRTGAHIRSNSAPTARAK